MNFDNLFSHLERYPSDAPEKFVNHFDSVYDTLAIRGF